jgi:hypothetical protein
MTRRMVAMILFLHGPRPLLVSGAPIPTEEGERIPLQKAPGLDATIDDTAFAARAGMASFLRAPLGLLHSVWFLVPILAWVGVVLAFRKDPRATVLWLIVPLYYLIFESPFLYEWRVAVPMQYFLLAFAGVSLSALTKIARSRTKTSDLQAD